MELGIITLYICPICKTRYEDKEEALDCLARALPKAVVEVGDIVILKSGYGWFDGDIKWIVNPTVDLNYEKTHPKCLSRECSYSFFYVITAIDQDPANPHRLRYHVTTKAMTGKRGHREGYTFVRTHYTPIKVENPPEAVVRDSKDLIGNKAKWLF